MKITLVADNSGDWEGIYIDNNLQQQGHSINLYNLLYTLRERGYIDFEYTESRVEDGEGFPEDLNDLNLEE